MGKIYLADRFAGLICFYYEETQSGKRPRGSRFHSTNPKLANCVGVLSTTSAFWTPPLKKYFLASSAFISCFLI
jgi:hypothetical protein